MAGPTATARLELDAKAFDAKANASFTQFAKSLSSVKDATDAAMRGAEALQKTFVKSLGGTIAIGAASALGDAVRDVGNRISSAADAAREAVSGMTGFSGSLEEAAARAQKLSAASDQVRQTLTDLSQANPIQAGIFKLFGGDQVLQDLEETTKSLAGLELLSGLQQGNKTSASLLAAGPEGEEGIRRKAESDKARRDLRSSAAFRGADSGTQQKIMAAFEKKLLLEESIRTQKESIKLEKERLKAEKDFEKGKKEMMAKQTSASLAESAKALKKREEDEEKERQVKKQASDLLAKAETELAEKLKQRAQKETETAKQKATALRDATEGSFLGASRAGRQDQEAAAKRRERENKRDDFRFQDQTLGQMAEAETNRTGRTVTKADIRKRMAAEEAARAAPSLRDRVGAAGMGMDASDFAGQRFDFEASGDFMTKGERRRQRGRLGPLETPAPRGLLDTSRVSAEEVDSRFRAKLQKDAAAQGAGSSGTGNLEKILQDVLNKLTSAPVINI